jgi:hypothetical protein
VDGDDEKEDRYRSANINFSASICIFVSRRPYVQKEGKGILNSEVFRLIFEIIVNPPSAPSFGHFKKQDSSNYIVCKPVYLLGGTRDHLLSEVSVVSIGRVGLW